MRPFPMRNLPLYAVVIGLGLFGLINYRLSYDDINMKKSVRAPNQQLFNGILRKEPGSLNLTSPLVSPSCSLLLVVISRPNERRQRQDVRQTWASGKHSGAIRSGVVSVIFVVGSNLRERSDVLEESNKFGDILVVDVVDSYNNIVYKELAAFSWLRSVGDNFAVAKIDSDTVLDVDKAYQSVLNSHVSGPWIQCRVLTDVAPIRDTDSSWYVSETVFSGSTYPAYCNGPLYIMSPGVAQLLLHAAQGAKVFEVEDVFFTGVLADLVDVERIDNPNIFHIEPTSQLCSTGKKATVIGYPTHHKNQTMQQSFQDLHSIPCHNFLQGIYRYWFPIR